MSYRADEAFIGIPARLLGYAGVYRPCIANARELPSGAKDAAIIITVGTGYNRIGSLDGGSYVFLSSNFYVDPAIVETKAYYRSEKIPAATRLKVVYAPRITANALYEIGIIR